MSVRRIESAYAYFLDKKISGTQMAVLQALAYCANEKDRERCFPSQATLAKMTHFSDVAVGKACNALRAMDAISWITGKPVEGGNLANYYTFKFPITHMPSRKEQYAALAESVPTTSNNGPTSPIGGTPAPKDVASVPNDVGRGTQLHWEGYPTTLGAAPNQVGTNTECKVESNPESNSESKSAPQPIFDMDFGSVLKRTNGTNPSDDPRMANASIDAAVYDREHSTPIQAALRVCGVTDQDNMRTFTHYASQFINKDALYVMWNIIERFWGEIKNNEHDRVINRASVLTTLFKTALANLS